MSTNRKTGADDLERVFRALADKTRLRMLRLLIQEQTMCVCEVMETLKVSQTRASRNLGILCDAGLLKRVRRGKWMYYSVDRVNNGRPYAPLLELVEKGLGRMRLGNRARRQPCI